MSIKLPREVIPPAQRTGAEKPNGSEEWSTSFIFPAGWTSKDHRKVAVVEPDPGWSLGRSHFVGSGSACVAFLLLCFLSFLNWLVLTVDEASSSAPGASSIPESKVIPTLDAPPPVQGIEGG
eukprot:g6419.t1